jgi:hypothetical protein
VDLVTVERAPLSVTIDADGQTRIRDLYEVASPIAGTARRAPVAVGDAVVADETVVAMVEPGSPALLDARSRAQAEATVAEARAALDVARSDLMRAGGGRGLRPAPVRPHPDADDPRRVDGDPDGDGGPGPRRGRGGRGAGQSRVAMSEGSLERAEATLARPDGGRRRRRLLRRPARAERRGGPVHRDDLGASGAGGRAASERRRSRGSRDRGGPPVVGRGAHRPRHTGHRGTLGRARARWTRC